MEKCSSCGSVYGQINYEYPELIVKKFECIGTCKTSHCQICGHIESNHYLDSEYEFEVFDGVVMYLLCKKCHKNEINKLH